MPSRDFALVAACCRWPTDVAAIQAVVDDGAIDWAAVVHLARRHRVAGFVRRGLVEAGLAIPPALADQYEAMIRRNLLQLGEATRLTAAFNNAGIAVAVLKGVVLAELAYGTQQVKHTVDTDLLIAPHDVARAFAILSAAGYRMTGLPDDIDISPEAMVHMIGECQFVHRSTGAIIDLHWHLHAHRQSLGEPDVATDCRIVQVAGRALSTLKQEDMMLFLTVHGARHSWSRLKWLADFNALLVRMNEDEIASLRALARRGGVAPCVDSALMQCGRLLGTAIPADAHRSARARALVRLSDAPMFGGDQSAQPGLYARRWFLATLIMNTRMDVAGSIFWHLWVSPTDMLSMPLPRPLHPLYAVISPARRVGRLVRRLAARGYARDASRPMRAPQEK